MFNKFVKKIGTKNLATLSIYLVNNLSKEYVYKLLDLEEKEFILILEFFYDEMANKKSSITLNEFKSSLKEIHNTK